MKPLKCPWNLCAKICLIVSGIFLFLFVINMNYFIIINSAAWFLLSCCFFIIYKKNALKLERQEGIMFEGEVQEIRPLYGVRIFHYITCRLHI